MIDEGPCKMHSHAEREIGIRLGHESHKRGLKTKLHLAMNSRRIPIIASITEGID